MPKLPDFSELTKKLDIQGLLDSVKSVVGGSSTPPKAPEGDEIAAKFVELITLAQNLVTTHAEQAKIIANMHHKLDALYKDVQALQQVALSIAESATSVAKTTKTADKSTESEEDK